MARKPTTGLGGAILLPLFQTKNSIQAIFNSCVTTALQEICLVDEWCEVERASGKFEVYFCQV